MIYNPAQKKKYIFSSLLIVSALFFSGTVFAKKDKDGDPTPTATPTASPTASPSASKVYVCKYVGTPGVDERLQTGQNPIEVSVNALPDGWSVGSYFNDQQGRSFILATVPQNPKPKASDCPPASGGSSTPTATATPTGTAVATAVPTATATSIPEPTSTATPNGDVCPNLDGVQLSLPDEYHFDNDGINCLKFELGGPPQPPAVGGGSSVLGASTSQVLGASTMAGTGVVEDSIFYSVFTLGSLLSSFGIMKNGRKNKKI